MRDYCQACLNPGCTQDGLCERCRERVKAVSEEFARATDSAADQSFMDANAIWGQRGSMPFYAWEAGTENLKYHPIQDEE